LAFYAGFISDDRGLRWVGSRWRPPWRADIRFVSSGIEVISRGELAETLAWEDYGREGGRSSDRTWWINPRLMSAGPTTVEVGVQPSSARSGIDGQRRWKLGDPPTSQKTASAKRDAGGILQALCQYVVHTPDARQGFDDHSKCARLVDALRAERLRGPASQGEPLYIGRKGELRQALDHTAEATMRYFRGRTVEGEPVLTAEELAEATTKRLPSWVEQGTNTTETLRSLAADRLAIKPWPFGLLRENGLHP
jgi:hypothetical protein